MLEVIIGIILAPIALVSIGAFIIFSIGFGKAIAKMIKENK